MTLPRSVCPRELVRLPSSGEEVEVRGLTRTEAIGIRDVMELGLAAVEVLTLAHAFDEEPDVVEEWHSKAANDDIEVLTNAVARLSGLDADEGKGGAGTSLSANGTELITSSLRPSV